MGGQPLPLVLTPAPYEKATFLPSIFGLSWSFDFLLNFTILFSSDTVDGRNPKQPPGMYKTP